uniref:Farnesoic acid O-methyl transferase domain-containing protein n=1 Tax=Capitella teleta TaxID=283909 RepID=X2B7D1_CAPTE
MTFRVKACSDAHIAVAPTSGVDLTEAFYDIVLSGWENTRTQIRRVQNGLREDVSEPIDTTGLLDCDHFKDFWVSWANNVVQVGKGIIPRHHVLLSHSLNDIYPIKAVAISTGFDHEGEWKIDNDNALWTAFATPVDFGYHYVWETVEHKQGIVFSVRACSDVHVILSDVIRDTADRYDIVIGGWANTKSAIRTFEQKEHVSVSTPEINSCQHHRAFWITWQNGAIEVGQGEIIGLERIMDYQILDMYPVRAVGFSTGYAFNGTW